MQKEQNVRLVLASASPRRRELLSQIGLEFTVMPSAPNSVLQPYLEMIFEFYDSGEKVL